MEDRSKEMDEIRQSKELERRRQLKLRRHRIRQIKRVLILVLPIIIIIGIIIAIGSALKPKTQESGTWPENTQGIDREAFFNHPQWEEDFLTPNKYSRPGYPLKKVNNIFVHYVANPGTSAKQNRDYFEQLSETKERNASSHFIIGCEGEIIQCVPLDEIAYAVKQRNNDSISIECCHPAEDGAFTQATYNSLLELLRWLLEVYNLDKDDVLRHYDSNGKLCPLYYVENEDAWEQLKNDI